MRSLFILVIITTSLVISSNQAPRPSNTCSSVNDCPSGFECIPEINEDFDSYGSQCVEIDLSITPQSKKTLVGGTPHDDLSTGLVATPFNETTTDASLPHPSQTTDDASKSRSILVSEPNPSVDPETTQSPCRTPKSNYSLCLGPNDKSIFVALKPVTASQRCFEANTICDMQMDGKCGFSIGASFMDDCVFNSSEKFI